MKRVLLIAATAFALCGCFKMQEDEVLDEIAFDAATFRSNGTKAVLSGSAYTYDMPHFKVFIKRLVPGEKWENATGRAGAAQYADVECSPYQTDVNSEKIWEGTPTAYWPLSGSLTFVGVSPFSMNSDFSIDNSDAVLTVSGVNIADQIDLLYSYASNACDLTSEYAGTTYKPEEGINGATGVPIIFHHALSQILININTVDGLNEDIYFQVSELSFKDSETGDLRVLQNNDMTAKLPEWTISGENKTSILENRKLTHDSSTHYTMDLDDTADGEQGFLAFPQTDSDSYTNPVIVLKYEQFQNSGRKDSNGNVIWSSAGTKDLEIPIFNDDLKSLQAGYKYTLNLTLSASSIKYAPSIDDWDTGSTTNTEL